MTYHNDPNSTDPNRRALRGDTSYTGWIIGGAVALAVMAGIFMMYNRNGVNTPATPNAPAVTTTAPATPSTTGSATPASPTPAAR